MKPMTIQRIRVFAALIMSGILGGGCATMTKPFPNVEGTTKMVVTGDAPSYLHDWPPGTYRIPDTNVLVSNSQGDESSIGPAILFGFAGVEINGGGIAAGIKDKLKGSEDALNLNIRDQADGYLQNALANSNGPGRFSYGNVGEGNQVIITPYMVLSYIDEVKARLWVILKAELFTPHNRFHDWYCRYIASLGDPRPLKGEDGCLTNQGKNLQNDLNLNMQAAFDVMFRDLYGNLRTGKPATGKMNGRWVFFKYPHKADVKVLERTDDWDAVLAMNDDDEYYAGVNILPKDFAEPMTAK